MSSLESNLDTTIKLSSQEIQRFTEVSDVVERAVTSGTPREALIYGRALRRSAQANHLMLAKLLFELHSAWSLFQAAGVEDVFEDVVEAEIGAAPATVHKYISMWQDIFGNPAIPSDIQTKLLGKPVKFLLRLGPAAREGDIIDWNEIVQASNAAEVGDIIKKVRGERTSSSSRIIISIDMRSGKLFCKRAGDGYQIQFGFLDLENADETSRVAIERLLDAAGVMRI